ncbi:hypothetical protein Hdeb2414_s0014g00421731 [Helianthus debilis subsp. tardiflorus]
MADPSTNLTLVFRFEQLFSGCLQAVAPPKTPAATGGDFIVVTVVNV